MKNILKIIITAAVVLFAVFSFANAQQNPFNIEFPIADLGNCGSQEECRVYCDGPANIDACVAWAEGEGIVTPPPPVDDKFSRILEEGGPGGCDSPGSCDAYCSQPENQDACFAFAKEHDLIPPEELERIEEFKEMEQKAGPGGCSSREECDNFCRQPENSQMCLQFAVDEGHLSQEDADFLLERMQMHEEFRGPSGPRGPVGPGPVGPPEHDIDVEKAMELVGTIGGPGGCSSFDECDAFCSVPENDEMCMAYAIEHDLISEEEIEKFERLMNIEGPGGCRGRECEAYCENEDHAQECLAFAIENELIDPEEEAEIRKFMEIAEQGGPGGCKGREECDAYCSQPEHGEECFAFAKEHDLIPEHELEMMEREMEIMMKLEAGPGGPGGCKGPEECEAYCSSPDHSEECMAFAVESGMMDPREMERMKREMAEFERFGGPGGMHDGDFGPGPGGFMPPHGEFEMSREFDGGEFEGEFEFEVFDDHYEEFSHEDFDNFSPENFEEFMPEGFENFKPEDMEHMQEEFKEFMPEEFKDFRPEDFQDFMPPQDFPAPEHFENFRPTDESSHGVGEFNDFKPPEGFIPPPDGFLPPEGFEIPQDFQPPQEPVGHPTEPISKVDKKGESLLGNILNAFLNLFR